MGGGTTLVTAGKHFSPKVPVSSCTGTGLQCLEKEGAGGAAVRLAGTPQSNTAQLTGGAEGKRVRGDGVSMLLRPRAASVLQASLTSYRSHHLPTHLLVDQSFAPHGL